MSKHTRRFRFPMLLGIAFAVAGFVSIWSNAWPMACAMFWFGGLCIGTGNAWLNAEQEQP